MNLYTSFYVSLILPEKVVVCNIGSHMTGIRSWSHNISIYLCDPLIAIDHTIYSFIYVIHAWTHLNKEKHGSQHHAYLPLFHINKLSFQVSNVCSQQSIFFFIDIGSTNLRDNLSFIRYHYKSGTMQYAGISCLIEEVKFQFPTATLFCSFFFR